MKMKLAIAAALSHGAELLILDEATSGLDPVVRDEVLDLLYDFMQDETHAILLSSHITSDLDKIADSVTLQASRPAKASSGESGTNCSDCYGDFGAALPSS